MPAIQYVTGTLTSSTSSVILPLTGDLTSYVYIYGTYSGVSFSFKASVDGTNFFPIQAYSAKSGNSITGTITLGTNATQAFIIPNGPWTEIQILASAYSSGTANVVAQCGPGLPSVPVTNVLEYNAVNVGNATFQLAAGNGGATPLVTSGPGVLHQLQVTTAGTVSLVLYDNASATSGKILYASAATFALGTTVALNLTFQNGVTANQATGTAAVTGTYILLNN